MILTKISDFSVWDLQDEFTTKEAAYLWLGLEPNHDIGGHSGTALSLMNTLSSAIDRQELSARKGDPRLWEGPYIKRDSLRIFAQRKGQRPLFLFPEDRPLSICSPALLSADQQRLPIVLAMLKELGFDPLDIPRSGKNRALNKLMERYPGKFTPDKFEETWKAGKRDGLFKMSS